MVGIVQENQYILGFGGNLLRAIDITGVLRQHSTGAEGDGYAGDGYAGDHLKIHNERGLESVHPSRPGSSFLRSNINCTGSCYFLSHVGP